MLVDSRTGRTLDHAQQLFRYLVLRGLDKKRHREGQQRAGGGDRIIETPRKPRTVADVEVEEDRDGNKLKASAEASAPNGCSSTDDRPQGIDCGGEGGGSVAELGKVVFAVWTASRWPA